MTKDVLVTISGTQFEAGDEAIELKVSGTYYFKNGKHYVMYEEQPEADGPVIKNLVKFYEDYFEITKSGGSNSVLLFQKDRQMSTMYDTVIGPMQIDTVTHELTIDETEDEIHVEVKYSLDINYNFVSECEVKFKVKAK